MGRRVERVAPVLFEFEAECNVWRAYSHLHRHSPYPSSQSRCIEAKKAVQVTDRPEPVSTPGERAPGVVLWTLSAVLFGATCMSMMSRPFGVTRVRLWWAP